MLKELVGNDDLEVHLTISRSAQKVLKVEHEINVDLEQFDPKALGVEAAERACYHVYDNFIDPMATGSIGADAMAIVPCSMGCIAAIARGLGEQLVERAAEVMIKERRPLIIVPRESPLSTIHLENMLALSRLGVIVLPASPGFYGKPQSVEDMVDFVVARVLDHLKIEHNL